jgi:nucleoside-diphosphate-sugar epimerase
MAMTQANRVLVTGSAGRIGQAVVKELLARGWPVRGFDRIPSPGLEEAVVGDIGDARAVQQAMAGVHTLIHLAATPDDDDFLTRLLPNNIIGAYHVLEAARLAGVRRLILASTGQVVWWQRHTGPWPVRVDTAVSPRYWYAATKMFLEAIGRGFAETHGMSVILARLGWCPRTVEDVHELVKSGWGKEVYLSPGDAGRFFACAVAAPADLRFATVFATSKPLQHMQQDLGPARDLVGYEPQDTWPQGIEVVLGNQPIPL